MNNKLFQLSDLYWASKWLISKMYYSILPIPVLIRMAKLKGLIKSFTSEKRYLVKKNLISSFGESKTEKEIQLIVQRHFGYLEVYELMFRLPKLDGFYNPEHWPVYGLQNLDSALSKGRGVILVITHFGYSRLLKYFLRMRGYKLWAVGAQKSKRIKAEKKVKQMSKQTAFRKFMYDRLQVPTVVQDVDLYANINLRPLVEVLKNNEILVINGDAQHAASFANLPLLGQLYPFPVGFMSLAVSTGAAILPAWVNDSGEGHGMKTIIGKPLVADSNGAARLDSSSNIEGFARIFESYIERYPHLFKIWTKENWFEKRRARSRKELTKRY